MNLVNRGYIYIRPQTKFNTWAKQIDPELLLDEQAEGTVYLIEEEFWDDEKILQQYLKKITTHEFSSITEEKDLWLSCNTTGEFEALFYVEIGCTCIDLRKDPLQRDAI